MSLVGTRPILQDELLKYELHHRARIAIKSCMAGFVLKNTLSDNGGVTRGICKMNEDCNLTEVVETKNIVKTAAGVEAEGMAVDVDSLVSMNMWGLTPDFFTTLEEGFKEFFEKEVPGNPLKAEYLIPIFIGELLEHYEVLADRVHYFKEDEKGVAVMCKAMEDMRNEAAKMKAVHIARLMLDGGKLSYEDIAAYTELTIEEVEKIASEKKSA